MAFDEILGIPTDLISDETNRSVFGRLPGVGRRKKRLAELVDNDWSQLDNPDLARASEPDSSPNELRAETDLAPPAGAVIDRRTPAEPVDTSGRDLLTELGGFKGSSPATGYDRTRLDKLTKEQDALNAPPAKRSFKRKLLDAALLLAPTAIGGAFGGVTGAGYAAEGTTDYLDKQKEDTELKRKHLTDEIQQENQRAEKGREFDIRQSEVEAQNEFNRTYKSDVLGLNRDKFKAGDSERLAKQGLRRDEAGNIVDIPEGELAEGQRIDIGAKRALTELREAQAELARAKADPDSLLYQMASDRVKIAEENVKVKLGRLHLSQQIFERDTYGTVDNEAIPGAPEIDGKPVGFKTLAAGEKGRKQYDQAVDADKRVKVMKDNETRANQAERDGGNAGSFDMVLLFNHMAMTGGDVKGMRMGEEITRQHAEARSIPESVRVMYNHIVNGGALSAEQRRNFVSLAEDIRVENWSKARRLGRFHGAPDEPEADPSLGQARGAVAPSTARQAPTAKPADGVRKKINGVWYRSDGKRWVKEKK